MPTSMALCSLRARAGATTCTCSPCLSPVPTRAAAVRAPRRPGCRWPAPRRADARRADESECACDARRLSRIFTVPPAGRVLLAAAPAAYAHGHTKKIMTRLFIFLRHVSFSYSYLSTLGFASFRVTYLACMHLVPRRFSLLCPYCFLVLLFLFLACRVF
ncbi:hypothetical protein DFH09DRAFT_1190470 [Mycena vulgaris]|nr:hypothetical protein DFH09DRAFT_1190470 [Mycena vulgaris]